MISSGFNHVCLLVDTNILDKTNDFTFRILSYSSTLKKVRAYFSITVVPIFLGKVKDKVHPCTGTEALYMTYGP